jgi:Flp pilus assembly protein TadD
MAEHESRNNCAGCHMPARRTDDVVHAVMTDHRIQRCPPGDLLAPLTERSTPADTAFQGEVTPYYPAAATTPDDELYFAMAQVVRGANLTDGVERLRSLIKKQRPTERGFYFELGAAYEKLAEFAEAAAWFEEALQMDPSFALARRRLGVALSQAGEFSRADEVLRQADQSDPETLKELGLNAARAGNFRNAIDVMRRAIALDADLPELHNNLGGALGELV